LEHKTYRGKVAYIGDEVGERGREWFAVTRHPSGSRTMQAMCEIDDKAVLRDVTYSVNESWQPLDAFVRLTVKDTFMGSGWFRFTENLAECESFMADGGRVSQKMEVSGRIPFFGAHPVAGDCWCLGGFERKSGERVQVLRGGMMSSQLSNGASGPLLSRMNLAIEYVGQEAVSVPAGTFQTEHFRFLLEDRPAEDLWVHGEDLLIVKIRWDLLATTYQLVSLEGYY